MPFNSKEHHRRSVRLKGYDYSSPGAYFITICTFQHHHLFGRIIDGSMLLNELGRTVAEEWLRTPQIRPVMRLDEWVVMPSHIHGIVIITALDPGSVGASAAADRAPHSENCRSEAPVKLARKPRTLSSMVAGFKSVVTERVNLIRGTPRKPVWQDNYHEHVIRNEES